MRSVSTTCSTLVTEWQDIASLHEVHLAFKQTGTFTADFNADLAQILLSNLIRNAIIMNKLMSNCRSGFGI